MMRAVVEAGEHEQHRPAAHRDRPQQHQRLAHRGDLLAHADERGVREPDELVREPGVLGDHPLELLEADARARARRAPTACRAGASGWSGPRSAPAARRRGPGTGRSRARGRRRSPRACRRRGRSASARAGAATRASSSSDEPAWSRMSSLTAFACSDSACHAVPVRKPSSATVKPVSRSSLSTSSSAMSAPWLPSSPITTRPRRERQRPHRDEHLARELDVRRTPAGDVLEPDVGDGLHEHARGRVVHVSGGGAAGGGGEEQLVAGDLLVAVEDRLASHHHLGGGGFEGRGGHKYDIGREP